MNQIINLANIDTETLRGNCTRVPSTCSDCTNLYGLTLDILVENNPGKVLFSFLEAGSVLNVKDQFIRRRVLNGSIKAINIGDKPMIHITEITRLTLEGVN